MKIRHSTRLITAFQDTAIYEILVTSNLNLPEKICRFVFQLFLETAQIPNKEKTNCY